MSNGADARTMLRVARRSGCVLLACAFFAAAPAESSAAPTEAEGAAVAFARIRRKDVASLSAARGIAVPAEFNAVFDAIEDLDWQATSNAWLRVRSRLGQDAEGAGESRIRSVLWQPVLEAYGFYEQVHLWHPDLLLRYAEEILDSLAPASIYFGGTDPGRFVITALKELEKKPDVFIITQNALADNLYSDYIDVLYGGQLLLPDETCIAKAFQTYVEEVKSGKRPRNAQITIDGGRVRVTGVLGVMEINSILAHRIFEDNRGRHSFFLEESYVIPWMYPYLEPHGLIMKLNVEETALTDPVVDKDMDYWSDRCVQLAVDPHFRGNRAARVTYAKLRSAIGGLYARRGRPAEAEKAFKQARALWPALPEASFRLAHEVYVPQGKLADAVAAMEVLAAHDPGNAKALATLRELKRKAAADAPESDSANAESLRLPLQLPQNRGKTDIYEFVVSAGPVPGTAGGKLMDRVVEVLAARLKDAEVKYQLLILTDRRLSVRVQTESEDDRDRVGSLLRSVGFLQFRLVHEANADLTETLFRDDVSPPGYRIMAMEGERFYVENGTAAVGEKGPSGAEIGDFRVPEPGYEFMLQERVVSGRRVCRPYFVKRRHEMTGESIEKAKVAFGPLHLPRVEVTFDATGARKLRHLTADYAPGGVRNPDPNRRRQLAIVIDGKLYTAPVIREAVYDGKVEIAGDCTLAEAQHLASVLNSGALPCPVSISEARPLP